MEKFYDKFNNLFSISKTLRFELKPALREFPAFGLIPI